MRAALLTTAAILTAHMACRAADTGPVTIGGVTYDSVDPGEPFKEQPRPTQDWQPPEPTSAEKAAGMIAYLTPDPGEYKPYRLPKREEHARKLSAFLARGEDEAVWFGAYGLADLQGLTVTVNLQKAPLLVDVRHMHFWPQRTGWRSREWYITPELLLPCYGGKKVAPAKRGVLEERSFDLEAGETAAFWLTLSAPAEAKAGVYKASVTVSSEGRRALNLPLEVEVLPLKLQRPTDRYWLLYCDSSRWGAMSDGQVMAELRDFARHGMTGLVEMPLGTPDLSQLREGKVAFDASQFKKLAEECREACLPGPHVCSYGGMPERVREALGLKCDVMKEQWPEELKEGVSAIARAAVEATKDAPAKWLFYGWDEPSGDNTYAIQDYQCWRRGGATTYATFGDPRFLEKASEYLTAPCFVSPLISTEQSARAAREACERTGAELWWYGTGSYVNPVCQEARMFPNRYGAGYLFWKSRAKAQVSWTFCRPHEDVFNDFDGSQANSVEPKEQATAYPHFLKPDDWSTYQGAIPTIAWEALREGVDDYSYLNMLTSLIAEAGNSEKKPARDAAKEAQAALEALVQAIPWADPLSTLSKEEFETKCMQQVRRVVAGSIVDLQAAMAGRRRKAAHRCESRITLRVRTVGPSQATTASLPVIPVMPTSTPPEIEGKLDDPCWKDSAVGGTFRYASSGNLAATPTEARILYDDRALYVAFNCYEPAMDKLVANQSGHDTPMVWVDDGIEFFVAASTRDKYAHVIVNTNRSVYDEINQNPSWDPAIEVGLQRGRDHWSVELALPWAELEQAGVVRSAVMAVNFCRSRFAGPEESPHTSWSCTYRGFHVPQRFGVALLQEGTVALADLQMPGLWGNQFVAARLRNMTDAPLTAETGLVGSETKTVSLPPCATEDVQLPLDLLKPGPLTVTLTWGIAGKPPQRANLALTVPAPVSVTGGNWVFSDGDTIDLPISVNIAPGDAAKYRVRVAVVLRDRPLSVGLPAKPGEERRIKLSLRDSAVLQVSLMGRTGQPIGESIAGTVFALGW